MEGKAAAAAGPMDIWVTAEEAILDKRETCLFWDLAGQSPNPGEGTEPAAQGQAGYLGSSKQARLRRP